MVQKIEILVHAGAPSNRGDDDRYKAQAEAYLAFEGRVVALPEVFSHPNQDKPHNVGRPGTVHSNIVVNDETTVVEDGSTVFLDDTQLAYAALNSQLATSSLVLPAEISFRSSTGLERLSPQNVFTAHGESAQSDGANQLSYQLSSSPEHLKRKRGSDKAPGRVRTEVQAVPDNVSDRPAIRNAPTPPGKTPETNEPSHSSYLKSPVLDRPAKKAKMNNVPQHNDVPPYMPFPEGSRIGLAYIGDRTPSKTIPSVPGNRSRSQGSIDGHQTTSELPTSYSLSDITSDSSRAKQGISQRSASDPGPQIGSISPTALRAVPTPRKAPDGEDRAVLNTSKEEHKTSATMERAGKRHVELEQRNLGNNQATVTFNTAVRRPSVQQQQDSISRPLDQDLKKNNEPQQHLDRPSDPTAAALEELEGLPTSISPPEPTTSIDKYTSYVTERLNYLETDIGASYKPASVSRELRPLERGYWLVDCSPWSLPLQISFWQFLQKFVGGGSAGWGVWCTRGDEEHQPIARQSSLGPVKIFCWGEIVKHVYLMLYVASKSQVRKLGLQWVDSGGEVVVQMRHG